MTKEELQQIRYTKVYIESRKQEILILREQLQYIRGIDYSKDITGTTQTTQEDLVCILISEEVELMRKIKEFEQMKNNAKEKIAELDKHNHRLVLYHRYILCKDWEDIAKRLNYSRRQVTRLHGEALVKLKKLSYNVLL